MCGRHAADRGDGGGGAGSGAGLRGGCVGGLGFAPAASEAPRLAAPDRAWLHRPPEAARLRLASPPAPCSSQHPKIRFDDGAGRLLGTLTALLNFFAPLRPMSIAVGRVILEFCFEVCTWAGKTNFPRIFLRLASLSVHSLSLSFRSHYTDDFLLLAKKTMWFIIRCLRDKAEQHAERGQRVESELLVVAGARAGSSDGRRASRWNGACVPEVGALSEQSELHRHEVHCVGAEGRRVGGDRAGSTTPAGPSQPRNPQPERSITQNPKPGARFISNQRAAPTTRASMTSSARNASPQERTRSWKPLA